MTNHNSKKESQEADEKINRPKFCQDCGLSLVRLQTFCSSRICDECGKEVFFIRRGEDGGVRIEKGEKFHVPQLTLSLNPASGGQFSRYGLEGFIKQLFLEKKISSKEELIDTFKEAEKQLDNELNALECISHSDLENEAHVEEASRILQSEGLNEYTYNLFRSSLLRKCYSAIENGDALTAAYAAHQANIFKEFSLLEHHHLKEIIWLGYVCYVDITKNEGMTEQAAKEKKLIKGAITKIRNFDTEYLFALANDGSAIAPRLTLSGVSENTLKSLIEHELDRRDKDREEKLKKEEIKIKKEANSIKLWGFLFTLANGLILALYKGWIG
jgi:hypothetical protein